MPYRLDEDESVPDGRTEIGLEHIATAQRTWLPIKIERAHIVVLPGATVTKGTALDHGHPIVQFLLEMESPVGVQQTSVRGACAFFNMNAE